MLTEDKHSAPIGPDCAAGAKKRFCLPGGEGLTGARKNTLLEILMDKKERLLAIFMLFCFVVSVAVLIIGTLNGNEPLVLSGFGVLIAVFLYSLYAKKRLDSAYHEEQERRNAEKARNEKTGETAGEARPEDREERQNDDGGEK